MTVNTSYVVTEEDESHRRRSWSVNSTARDEHTYTYDEAIDLAGNGCYSLGLLVILSIATLSMGVDIFGVSVVVTGATCDFELGIKETETSIILSLTFIGPIMMAYPWGYLSDTQGRRKSLLISLWTSFLMSAASTFSPNWITFAVLKLFSTSFSSCAQSTTYTLLGESCSRRFRDTYMIIMAGLLDFSLAVYVGIAYLILNMEFSYDLYFITFTQWRLLALVLSLLMGVGAFGLMFFYESPKFLLNDGRHDEALDVLAQIWRRNGGKKEFPVKKVVLTEVGNERLKDTSLWRSLWQQLEPIFTPPLLWRSLQLYFMAGIVYGTNNAYFMWLPYLSDKFISDIGSNATNEDTDFCTTIITSDNTSTTIQCPGTIDIGLVWFSLIQGVTFVLVLFAIASIAQWKRWVAVTVLLVSGCSCLGAVLFQGKITSLLMIYGLLSNQLTIGIIFSYYVDIFPTSFRGTAACMGTMVARLSALSGVKLLGDFLMSNCTGSFYTSSALMFCGVLLAFVLPTDQKRHKNI